MDFNDYQRRALSTAIYPNVGSNWVYPMLGLIGEVGEVAEKLKKVLRDSGGVISDEQKHAIFLELGDIMWYLAVLSSELGFDLNSIAEANVDKLQSRKDRNVLSGSGDTR